MSSRLRCMQAIMYTHFRHTHKVSVVNPRTLKSHFEIGTGTFTSLVVVAQEKHHFSSFRFLLGQYRANKRASVELCERTLKKNRVKKVWRDFFAMEAKQAVDDGQPKKDETDPEFHDQKLSERHLRTNQ